MQLTRAIQLLAALQIVGPSNGQQVKVTIPAEKTTAEQFSLFARHSAAAYCDEVYTAAVNSDMCLEVVGKAGEGCEASAKGKMTHHFRYEWGDVPAYMATFPDKKLVVLAFRGTVLSNFNNDLVDLHKKERSSIIGGDELCKDCFLHSGFSYAVANLSTAIKDAVSEQVNEMGPKQVRVVVTGHSLGGALATITGAWLRTKFPETTFDVYAYGSPRVGDHKFADFVMGQKNGHTMRITKKADVVTSIPWHLPPLMDYAHVYPEFWYEDGLKTDKGVVNPYENVGAKTCYTRRCGSDQCGFSPVDLKLWETCSISDHSGYDGGLIVCDKDRDTLATKPNSQDKFIDEMPKAMNKFLTERFLLFAAHAVDPAWKGSVRLCDLLPTAGGPYVGAFCAVRVIRPMTAQSERLLVLSFHEPARTTTLTSEQHTFESACAGCKVNADFLQALRPLMPPPATPSPHDLFWAVKHLNDTDGKTDQPNHRVVFTGYCGGGAMATLAAAYFRAKGFPVDLYTFGSPRVGNEAFAKFVTDYDKAVSARITGGGHQVVLTPHKKDQYRHYSPEFYFPQGLVNVESAKNLKICHGVEAEGCSLPSFSSGLEGQAAPPGELIYPSKVITCSSFVAPAKGM
ncbi:hypothetical protein CP533_0530 [Ophiocordyceps camponoti-saundersi (nom. inval.)]|nr:hypothetical protein CP533_0530 [Ophiocordyceps camponoti-saundersi (nom. inval.)]